MTLTHDANKILRLTLPLSPLLGKDADAPLVSKRLRPADSLNLRQTVRELAPAILTTLDLCGRPWSIIAVYSPYSPSMHVMLMETSGDRYLPAPDSIPDDEGEAVAGVIAAVLRFIQERADTESVYFGYNWSPRSWGDVEEQGGFQSIPTKWHAMIWGWPAFPAPGKRTTCADWIDLRTISNPARRIFGAGDYIEPFSALIASRLQANPEIKRMLLHGCTTGEQGPVCALPYSLPDMLTQNTFFSRLLKPAAVILDGVMRELTELFTTLDCRRLDRLLATIEKGLPDESVLSELRTPPVLRPKGDIAAAFAERGFPRELFPIMYRAVKARAEMTGKREDWWRKGFGYALVFGQHKSREHCTLRILPGLYVGPGGVVEAQKVYLKRRLDVTIQQHEMEERSRNLWELTEYLKSKFSVYAGRL